MKERLKTLTTVVNSKILPKIMKNIEIRNSHNITSNKVVDQEYGIELYEKLKRLF